MKTAKVKCESVPIGAKGKQPNAYNNNKKNVDKSARGPIHFPVCTEKQNTEEKQMKSHTRAYSLTAYSCLCDELKRWLFTAVNAI